MGKKIKDYVVLSEDCQYCRWYELRYVPSGGSGFWCGAKEVRVSIGKRDRKWCNGFEEA